VKHDKPVGEVAGWRHLDTAYPFVTPWLTIREDRVDIEDGEHIRFAYRVSKGAVVIVPVTPDGQIVLIRQYRYTVDDWCLEVPAGGMHDKEEGRLEDAARDELREEAGATCEQLILIGEFYSNNATTDEVMNVYLATGVELEERVAYEATEKIEVVVMGAGEVIEMARSGKMKDGLSALSVLLCEPKLRELGLL
jgi:ADP-ribose pyrophosphatase